MGLGCFNSLSPVSSHILTAIWVMDKHGDVIKWKHFPRYWPFVRGIPRSPVNSPPKCQWRGCFPWSAPWINGRVNNREADDLRRPHAHCDVIVMNAHCWQSTLTELMSLVSAAALNPIFLLPTILTVIGAWTSTPIFTVRAYTPNNSWIIHTVWDLLSSILDRYATILRIPLTVNTLAPSRLSEYQRRRPIEYIS